MQTGGQKITVVIRNAGITQACVFDRCFIVSKTSSQSQLLGRIPFQTDRIAVGVFILQIQNIDRSTGITERNWDLLQSAPTLQFDITHDREIMQKSRIDTEMVDLGKIQPGGCALIKKNIAQGVPGREHWDWQSHARQRRKRPGSSNYRHSAE